MYFRHMPRREPTRVEIGAKICYDTYVTVESRHVRRFDRL